MTVLKVTGGMGVMVDARVLPDDSVGKASAVKSRRAPGRTAAARGGAAVAVRPGVTTIIAVAGG